MSSKYSIVQKLSLAGTVIGSLLCVVGAGAPYWIISDPQGFSGLLQLVSKIADGNIGLFAVCIQVRVPGLVEESECQMLAIDRGMSRWFFLAQVTGAGCAILGLLSGMISLCLACCTCCKRIIAVGILSFIAASAGVASAVIFTKNAGVFTTTFLGFQLTSYGWAFYMFCVGVGVLGVVSFMACFSAPENPIGGMVLSQPAPGGELTVITQQQQQQCLPQQQQYLPQQQQQYLPQQQQYLPQQQ